MQRNRITILLLTLLTLASSSGVVYADAGISFAAISFAVLAVVGLVVSVPILVIGMFVKNSFCKNHIGGDKKKYTNASFLINLLSGFVWAAPIIMFMYWGPELLDTSGYYYRTIIIVMMLVSFFVSLSLSIMLQTLALRILYKINIKWDIVKPLMIYDTITVAIVFAGFVIYLIVG